MKDGLKRTVCSNCGEAEFQLVRVRDQAGKKIKPAQYVCSMCLTKNAKITS